jgi:uncharacterized RDD family membrane protein YckC
MVYEAVLLFGVVFIAGWIFSTLLQQRHALYMRHAQQLWQFFVLGVYFVWFWTHGGQTLPMKTWHIRLVAADGTPIKTGRAIFRYLLAWFWLLPGLSLAKALHAHGWLLLLFPAANMAIWALTVYLDPQRQFLHDRLAGTRLISLRSAPAPSSAEPAATE